MMLDHGSMHEDARHDLERRPIPLIMRVEHLFALQAPRGRLDVLGTTKPTYVSPFPAANGGRAFGTDPVDERRTS